MRCVPLQVLDNLPEDVPCHRSVSPTPVYVPMAPPPLPGFPRAMPVSLRTRSSHHRTTTATAVPDVLTKAGSN